MGEFSVAPTALFWISKEICVTWFWWEKLPSVSILSIHLHPIRRIYWASSFDFIQNLVHNCGVLAGCSMSVKLGIFWYSLSSSIRLFSWPEVWSLVQLKVLVLSYLTTPYWSNWALRKLGHRFGTACFYALSAFWSFTKWFNKVGKFQIPYTK